MWFFIGKNTGNFIYALALSIIFSLILMVILIYTYRGIFGYTNTTINIIINILVIIIGTGIFFFYVVQPPYPNWSLLIGWIIIIAIGIAFIVWSYTPPNIPLFLENLF